MFYSEYYFKPVIPPPFIFVSHFHRFISQFMKKESDEAIETKSTKTYFTQGTNLLTELEKWGTGVYLNEVAKLEQRSLRKILDDITRQADNNIKLMQNQVDKVQLNQSAFQFVMEQHFRQVTETLKWTTPAMVQSDITVKEGDDAGPPPNIQIPLNIRAILQQENNRFKIHNLARQPFYTTHDGTKIRRYPVPDARVPFLTAYDSYQPNEYTATHDDESVDSIKLSRDEMRDFENPVGRTGLRGRGVLHNWGENRQLVILIWKWLKDQNGENITRGGQEMIQVLGIRKTKYLHWQLPKIFLEEDENIEFQVRKMFYEQCLGRGQMHQDVRESFNWLFSKDSGSYDQILHDDYLDDHKNTG